MSRIRVLLADDHPSYLEGLARLLEEEPDIEVVAKTGDGEEAVALAKQFQPDVAVIDVAMPRLSGIEAARRISASKCVKAILMISAYDYQSYLLDSLHAGAAGYILKTTPVRELINSIRIVCSGQSVFSTNPMGKVLHHFTKKDTEGSGLFEKLQGREVEILIRVAKGLGNKEIGEELHISDRTVQSHLISIFRKLGVGSRTEAVVHALKEGWITLDNLS